MMIRTNAVYKSKAGECLVVPISATSERVILYIGQKFGRQVVCTDNRRVTMSRQEFEENYELAE